MGWGMLAAGACTAGPGGLWDGDLRHITTGLWVEESDVAAVVISERGGARIWMNARHIVGLDGWLVWLWAREQARHEPVAWLYAHELPARTGEDRSTTEV